MGKNPPGEQVLLFIFLKALKVYSAGETTNLMSSAEMLKRGREEKKKQAEESREGKRREGENGRIASVCFAACQIAPGKMVPYISQTQPCAPRASL